MRDAKLKDSSALDSQVSGTGATVVKLFQGDADDNVSEIAIGRRLNKYLSVEISRSGKGTHNLYAANIMSGADPGQVKKSWDISSYGLSILGDFYRNQSADQDVGLYARLGAYRMKTDFNSFQSTTNLGTGVTTSTSSASSATSTVPLAGIGIWIANGTQGHFGVRAEYQRTLRNLKSEGSELSLSEFMTSFIFRF
jgi:hypothetical protein